MAMSKKIHLLVFTIALLSITTSAFAGLHWVSFNGTGGVYKYVMQIDSDGNITKAPTAVLKWNLPNSGEPVNPFGEDSVNGPLGGPTAMALMDKSSTEFFLYIVGAHGGLWRFTVNKATLKPTNPLPTLLKQPQKDGAETSTLDFASLQATQHSPRFLAALFGELANRAGCCTTDITLAGGGWGFGINSNGGLDGTSNRITPRTNFHDQFVSVSADGLMAISNVEKHAEGFTTCCYNDNNNEEHIYAQPLKAGHLPKGDPVVVGISGDQTAAVDVSNPLPGTNKRLVVYNTRSLDDPDTSNGDDVVTQVIDKDTGAKSGGPQVLQSDQEIMMGHWQGVAVDPGGEFILFVKRPFRSDPVCCDTDTAQTGNRDSLYYLKVDSNGKAVGSPKLLYSADDGPFDGQHDEDTGDEFAWPQINMIDVMED
jgi:hypothetical protein